MSVGREPWFHWHWQNLNEKPGNRLGSPLRHGRAWFEFGSRNYRQRIRTRVEWSLGRLGFAFSFQVNDEDGMLFHAEIPGVSVWFAIGFPWLKIDWRKQREISFRIYGGSVWLDLWMDPNSWSHTDPRWRRLSVNLPDLLLGKRDQSTRKISETRVEIPMPEGAYPATVELEEVTLKRARWFAERFVRAEIRPDTPIPHPGKGENSWDCGEDATYGLTTPAKNVHAAVVAMVSTVLRSRYRHGGLSWRPAEAPHDR